MHYLVGLSGGVDSAVCAVLLKERGHAVTGVYLDGGEGGPEDARAVAGSLGIGFEVIDTAAEMREKVIGPFLCDYRRGLTPNPCVLCNPAVKFRVLLRAAQHLRADRVATGHYAVIRDGGLYKGLPGRDQSYMLYRLPPEWLPRLDFPLGEMDKPLVREHARAFGLEVASKRDSMDLCFAVPEPEREWLLVDRQGSPLGKQRGYFTIGQRRGLGVASAEGRLYVCGIDAQAGTVTLGGRDSVRRRDYTLRDLHMLVGRDGPSFSCLARIRHTGREQAALVRPLPDGGAALRFEEPAFGGAPGQSAVFYDGDRVLGGGIIC